MASTTFSRPPYIVHFRSLHNKHFDFALIGLHSEPKKAYAELKDLKKVYKFIADHWGEEDGLIMGDLNLSCKYFENQSSGELFNLLTTHPDRYDLQKYHHFSEEEIEALFPKNKYFYNPLQDNFHWHIGNYTNTTVGTTSVCAYDRILSTGSVTQKVIPKVTQKVSQKSHSKNHPKGHSKSQSKVHSRNHSKKY